MADKIKGLTIVLDADVGGLKGKLGEISKQAAQLGKDMEKAGKKIQGVADTLKPISTAAAAVGAGMLGAAYKSVTLADDLNTLAKQSGFTTEENEICLRSDRRFFRGHHRCVEKTQAEDLRG